ncbi:hypothetical protein PF005_g26737 [Phytophthora fragariae]|uniref:Uncharacterized protein n=1 Tax=Phytophthora fragariae TaxID=53985 RepID=A0A6A3VRX4_9STRA|nr:hypothetical protein PF005_g26737 [Phytophthora fragariae]
MVKRCYRDAGVSPCTVTQKKRQKTLASSSPASTSFLRLRSGPVVRHPLIIEAATMHVESLSAFELAPVDPSVNSGAVVTPAVNSGAVVAPAVNSGAVVYQL